MTGKELIDFIQRNNAEELQVVLIDTDSIWQSERLESIEIEIEETEEHEKRLLIY